MDIDKVILSLDFSDIDDIKKFIIKMGDSISFYKIGFELMSSGNYFTIIDFLTKKNKKIFIDLKLFDITNTIVKSIANFTKYDNIKYLTIHCNNADAYNSINNIKSHINILAVTLLTSFNQNDLNDNIFCDINIDDLILQRAIFAYKNKIDGVISSVGESKIIRQNTDNKFKIICPAISKIFEKDQSFNKDQKRSFSVEKAIKYNINHMVIGRLIYNSDKPVNIVTKIHQLLINA